MATASTGSSHRKQMPEESRVSGHPATVDLTGSKDAKGKKDPRDPKDGHLPLPHERDQSVGVDSTGGMGTGAAGEQQREVMDQAQQDLKQGQVDTDLRATPGLDAAQRKQLVSDPKAAPAPRGSVAESAKSDRKR